MTLCHILSERRGWVNMDKKWSPSRNVRASVTFRAIFNCVFNWTAGICSIYSRSPLNNFSSWLKLNSDKSLNFVYHSIDVIFIILSFVVFYLYPISWLKKLWNTLCEGQSINKGNCGGKRKIHFFENFFHKCKLGIVWNWFIAKITLITQKYLF